MSENDIQSQILWCNSNVRIAGKTFIYYQAYEQGLIWVKQLFNLKGGFLPTQVIMGMYGLMIMQVNSIVSALPKPWVKYFNNPIKDAPNLSNYDKLVTKNHLASIYYKQRNANKYATGKAHNKWVNKYFEVEQDMFLECFVDLYCVTNNVKLRSFQFRLLHDAIILNDKLYRWKIRNTNLCTNCELHKEALVHFFIECECAIRIWDQIREYCVQEFKEKLEFNKQTILLNQVHPN